MSDNRQRRLAAVLCADVVGYSALIGKDEDGTIAALRRLRAELIDPAASDHGGRRFKTTGDGVLFEFPSVVHAVEAALAVQTAMAGQDAAAGIRFRVGVHLGDVVPEGDDLLGDGVNIAARIEAQAESGGVALSDDAHRQVRDRLEVDWRDGGEQALKNIARPMRVWHWTPDGAGAAKKPPLEPQAKPSIAVLPFDNLSGDPEQEYFADGLVEDVTTALSRFSELFVTSRSSAFSFRGQTSDIRTIARELGVRYVVEGSVRRAGQRLRVTAQLIEAETDTHVWAERYDRHATDLFDIQDEITMNVAGAVGSEISRAELEKVFRRETTDLDSWGRQMKAVWRSARSTREDILATQEILRDEIARGNGSSQVHGLLAFVLSMDLLWGVSGRDPAKLIAEGLAAGRVGVSLDGGNEGAHSWLALFLFISGDHDQAVSEAQAAIRANGNSVHGFSSLGMALAYCGPVHLAQAQENVSQALRLGGRDPFALYFHANIGMSHLTAGHYDEAIECANRALEIDPNHTTPLRVLVSALALSGRIDEARETWARVLAAAPLNLPAYRASLYRLFKRDEDAEHFLSGLRLAGADL